MYNVYKYGMSYPIASYETKESAERFAANTPYTYMLYEPDEIQFNDEDDYYDYIYQDEYDMYVFEDEKELEIGEE
jgi:hypothetical protein